MEWRRVRDPEGVEVWVHARMLSGQMTGIVSVDATLKRCPDEDAEGMAILQTGVIVDILEEQNDMVKVRAERLQGWVGRRDIWGDQARSGS